MLGIHPATSLAEGIIRVLPEQSPEFSAIACGISAGAPTRCSHSVLLPGACLGLQGRHSSHALDQAPSLTLCPTLASCCLSS